MNSNTRVSLGSLSFAVCSLLTSACSNGSPSIRNPATAAQNEANAPQLSDHWESNCMKSKVLDAALRIDYDFAGDLFTETQTYFSEEDCRPESAAATVTYEGTHRVYTNASPNQLDFNYEKVNVVAKNEDGRTLLDRVDFCGVEVWVVGEAHDVSTQARGATCPLKTTPQARLEIFRVVGDNRLEMGSAYVESGADQPSERPTEFKTDAPYFKK